MGAETVPKGITLAAQGRVIVMGPFKDEIFLEMTELIETMALETDVLILDLQTDASDGDRGFMYIPTGLSCNRRTYRLRLLGDIKGTLRKMESVGVKQFYPDIGVEGKPSAYLEKVVDGRLPPHQWLVYVASSV